MNTPMEWAYAQVRSPSGHYISNAEGGGLIDAATGQMLIGMNCEISGCPTQLTSEGGGYAYDPGRTLRQVLYGNADIPIVDTRLQQIASAAGLYGFDWKPYQALIAQSGTLNNWNGFSNYMIPVLTWAMAAAEDYPQLWKVIPQFAEGTDVWIEGERVAQETRDRSKKAGLIEGAVMAVVGGFFGAATIAAGAAAGAAGSSIATVQGAELAALVEAGTVGVEGAFLEAAALSGSSVVYSTTTGTLLEAITPAGEAVAFDASVDPFTQFNQMPIDTVELPQDALQTPNKIPQTPSTSSTLDIPKPLTEYAKKLIAGEAMKLITGAPQSPGANAAQNTVQQGLAPGAEKADISPLLALAMIATALIT